MEPGVFPSISVQSHAVHTHTQSVSEGEAVQQQCPPWSPGCAPHLHGLLGDVRHAGLWHQLHQPRDQLGRAALRVRALLPGVLHTNTQHSLS